MRAAVALLALLACGGPRQHVRQGDAWLAQGRATAAARAYERALEVDPRHGRALLGLARAHLASGEPERAISPAQAAADAGTLGGWLCLARALVEAGQAAGALQAAQAARAEAPDDAEAAGVLAEVRLARGEHALAAEAAEAAVQASGGPRAGALAAWTHLRRGETKRAVALASRAAGGALDDAAVQAEAAAVFRYAGDAARARGSAEAALAARLDDQTPAVARRLAGGDLEGAARRLAWVRSLHMDDGTVARQLGQTWLALGEPALALGELEASLQLPPYPAASGAGRVQVADRRADALGPEERRAAVAGTWDAIALARAALGDPRGAAQARQAALEQRGGQPEDWVAQSRAWEAAGEPGPALEAALRAVSLQRDSAAALERCARLYAAMGEPDKAVGYARLAWDIEPRNPELSSFLADLYDQRGEPREARRVREVSGGGR